MRGVCQPDSNTFSGLSGAFVGEFTTASAATSWGESAPMIASDFVSAFVSNASNGIVSCATFARFGVKSSRCCGDSLFANGLGQPAQTRLVG